MNNLDNEALDAPVYNTMCNNPNLNSQQYQNGINNDFTSLPCDTFLMASRINNDNPTNDPDEFSYKNPMYQSAHVQVKSKPIVNDDENYLVENSEEGEFFLFFLFFFFHPHLNFHNLNCFCIVCSFVAICFWIYAIYYHRHYH